MTESTAAESNAAVPASVASTPTVPTGTAIWPCLTYRDTRAAIDFLERAFGFETRACYAEGEVVHHAELSWPGGGGVMLGSWREDMAARELPPGAGCVYIALDDVDTLHDRARAAGARVTRELREEEGYESRGFTVRDPEGVYWSFGTYRGHGES
ncbi:VOC family protein [Nocardia otitidiscaviarum]|nr:VOC family protein [Nocardia otitidiscaviarum]MBF6482983.1 VOC family protein [Nocardia otitidiscaviarum]